MFNIIGIIATVLVVIYFLVHVGIKVYNWCKDDPEVCFEVRKQSTLESDDWCYIIPTIGFHCAKSYVEFSTTWLGWQYYVCYTIKNYSDDYD